MLRSKLSIIASTSEYQTQRIRLSDISGNRVSTFGVLIVFVMLDGGAKLLIWMGHNCIFDAVRRCS